MLRCKAPEILSRESYWDVRRTAKDEGNAADGHFGRTPKQASEFYDP